MFCSNCGNKLADGARFCSFCGTKVELAEQEFRTIADVSFDAPAPDPKPVPEKETPAMESEPVKEEVPVAEEFIKVPDRDKLSFDWSAVVDEPHKREVVDIKSPWATTGNIEEKDIYEEMASSSDRSRTMSFIDMLKAEKEEKEKAAKEKAAADKSIEYTKVLEIGPELGMFNEAPELHFAPLYEDVDEPVKTPFDKPAEVSYDEPADSSNTPVFEDEPRFEFAEEPELKIPEPEVKAAEPAKEKDNSVSLSKETIAEFDEYVKSFEIEAGIHEDKPAKEQAEPAYEPYEAEVPKFELPNFLKGFGQKKDFGKADFSFDEPPVINLKETSDEDVKIAEPAETEEVYAAEQHEDEHAEIEFEEPVFEEPKLDIPELKEDTADDGAEKYYLDMDGYSDSHKLNIDDYYPEPGDEQPVDPEELYPGPDAEDLGTGTIDEAELFFEMEAEKSHKTGMTIAAPADKPSEIEDLKSRITGLMGTDVEAPSEDMTENAVPEPTLVFERTETAAGPVLIFDDTEDDQESAFAAEEAAAEPEPAEESESVLIEEEPEPAEEFESVLVDEEPEADEEPESVLIDVDPEQFENRDNYSNPEDFYLQDLEPAAGRGRAAASEETSYENEGSPVISLDFDDDDDEIDDKPNSEEAHHAADDAAHDAEEISPAVEEAARETEKELVLEFPADNLDPVVEEVVPEAEETAPVIEEVVPFVEETASAADESVPVVEEVAPAVEEVVPFVEEVAPAAEEAAPDVQEYMPAIEDAEPEKEIRMDVPAAAESVPEMKASDALSLEELEKDLFGEAPAEEVEVEETKKIDKFYTLYRKNEEFQRLLDEEYDKLRNGDVAEPAKPSEAAPAEAAAEKTPEVAVEDQRAYRPVEDETIYIPKELIEAREAEKAAAEAKAKAAAAVAAVEANTLTEIPAKAEDVKEAVVFEDEYEDIDSGSGFLTALAVIIAVILVILLAVILILHVAPESGAAAWIDTLIEKITGGFSSIDPFNGQFLL